MMLILISPRPSLVAVPSRQECKVDKRGVKRPVKLSYLLHDDLVLGLWG